MTCLIETLAASTSNAAYLPYDEADYIMQGATTGVGPLMLFEPAHPGVPSGSPALPEVGFNLGFSRNAIQFPNVAARPAVATVGSLANSFTVTASQSGGTFTVTSPVQDAIHEGDEVWNSANTVMLGVIAFVNTTLGLYTVTPAQTLSSGTYTIRPGIKPVVIRNGARNSSNVEINFKSEYTPKGGLHIASSRTTMGGTNVFMGMFLPGAIRRYIAANPSREYYFSAWYRITAPLLSGFTGPYVGVAKNDGSNGFFRMSRTATNTLNNLAFDVGSRNTTGMCVEQASNIYRGTALSNSTTDFMGSLFHVGGLFGSFGTTYANNNSMSVVIYRLYLEDLTASGRTFAQVKQVDDWLYAAKFGAGGSYNGDTFTTPTTLIP